MLYRFISLSGLVVMIGLAWVCSTNRRGVNWGLVAKGVGLQFLFAVLILYTAPGRAFFDAAGTALQSVLDASQAGTRMVFGDALTDKNIFGSAMGDVERYGFIFCVTVTGTIILVSALMSALYYIGVMQWIVWAVAKVMQVVMGTSGSESLAAAVNIFVGQTEAALVIKPYLPRMTKSEIMALMTAGMATIASGVMVSYVGFLSDAGLQGAAGHILAASVMSAPASLVISKIILPETAESETFGHVPRRMEREGVNFLDAVCTGAADGMKLSINVMAMLIAFTALVYLLNMALVGVGAKLGIADLTLDSILGRLFQPLALAMGVSLEDSGKIGAILGKRTILNEFIAYVDLAAQLKAGGVSPRSAIIATYALCGFANFASIAIQIGGIGSLAPTRREDLARFGLRAMIGGTLASFMTANIAGALL